MEQLKTCNCSMMACFCTTRQPRLDFILIPTEVICGCSHVRGSPAFRSIFARGGIAARAGRARDHRRHFLTADFPSVPLHPGINSRCWHVRFQRPTIRSVDASPNRTDSAATSKSVPDCSARPFSDAPSERRKSYGKMGLITDRCADQNSVLLRDVRENP